MRGLPRGLKRRFSKKTWALIALGICGVLLLGGGAYAALGGPLRQQSSSDIELQRGLVGWWKLDGSTQDSTPYRNSATLVNGPPTASDRKGKTNGAYSLNGTGQGLNIPGSAMPTTDLSISMWVYQTAWANWYDLASINYGTLTTQTGWDLFSDTNGAVAFGLQESGGAQSRAICSNGIMSLNKWHHLVGSFDGTTVRAYVDGVVCGTTASYSGSPLTNSSVLKIGERAQGTTHYVDDIRVYNRAISGAEVKALYDQYDPAVNAASGEKGLAGWWKLDGNTKDSSPNRNNGTASGVTPTTDRKGKANGAYNFPGSGSNNISFGNSAVFNASEMTMASWIHPTALSTTTTDEIMAKEMQYKMRLDGSGQVCVLVSGNGTGWTYNGCPTPNGTIVVGNWYHIATTISSSGNSIQVYVNGSLAGSATIGTTITAYNTNPLVLGAYNTAGTEPFTGDMDDARFYGRVLSAAEVMNLYNSYDSQINLNSSPTNTASTGNINTGLVGYWAFTGNAKDSTPYRNNGTVTNATLTTGQNGSANSAYNFNGTSAVITVPQNAVLDFGTGDMTLAVWARTTMNPTGGSYPAIITKETANTTPRYGYDLFMVPSSNGQAGYQIWSNGTSNTVYSSVAVNDGNWHLLVGTRSGSNMKFYVDGQPEGSTASGPTGSISVSNRDLGIGARSSSAGGGYWFAGDMDGLRLYNRALSPSEVQSLYQAGN